MYEYNFEKDKDFFNKSVTFNKLSLAVKKHEYLEAQDPKIIDISLKVWAESVLKHNLSAHISIDPILLITDENSKEIKKTLGKIMSKSNKTDNDYKVLRAQTQVNNIIMLNVLRREDPESIYRNLKNEFKEYKENLTVIKKVKP